MQFDVGWPPTINTAYGITKTGSRYLRPKGKTYKARAAFAIKTQTFGLPSFGKQSVFAIIYLYPPDKRVRDTDNIKKLLFDSITMSGIIDDDRYLKGEQLLTQMDGLLPEKPPGTIAVRLVPYGRELVLKMLDL